MVWFSSILLEVASIGKVFGHRTFCENERRDIYKAHQLVWLSPVALTRTIHVTGIKKICTAVERANPFLILSGYFCNSNQNWRAESKVIEFSKWQMNPTRNNLFPLTCWWHTNRWTWNVQWKCLFVEKILRTMVKQIKNKNTLIWWGPWLFSAINNSFSPTFIFDAIAIVQWNEVTTVQPTAMSATQSLVSETCLMHKIRLIRVLA